MTPQVRHCGRRLRVAFRIPRLRASLLGALKVSLMIPVLTLTAVSAISFPALLFGGDDQGSQDGISMACCASFKGHDVSATAHLLVMSWNVAA